MSETLWHPKARKVRGNDAGAFTGGGKKLVIHTTEGKSLDAAVNAYKTKNAWPHFTLGVSSSGERILVQHLPINVSARALQHTLGPETNRANAIQVEVLEFAKNAQRWDPKLYRYLKLLALWVHRHYGVPLEAHHPFFGQRGYHRLSGGGWVRASGIVGHCHCPGNDHWDPGNFPVGKVID